MAGQLRHGHEKKRISVTQLQGLAGSMAWLSCWLHVATTLAVVAVHRSSPPMDSSLCLVHKSSSSMFLCPSVNYVFMLLMKKDITTGRNVLAMVGKKKKHGSSMQKLDCYSCLSASEQNVNHVPKPCTGGASYIYLKARKFKNSSTCNLTYYFAAISSVAEGTATTIDKQRHGCFEKANVLQTKKTISIVVMGKRRRKDKIVDRTGQRTGLARLASVCARMCLKTCRLLTDE